MKSPDGKEVAVKDPAELVKRPEGTLAVPETASEGDPLRIVLTSLDKNIDNFAREAAHEKLAKKHEGPFWKKAVMSFWHNVTREYQLVKATQEAREEILKSGNLRHHHGKDDAPWKEATVSRYGSDYGEQLIHADRGETYHKLGAEEAEQDPSAKRIREDMLDSVRRYAKGEIADRASFEMMQDRKAEKWREEGIGKEYIGEGQLLTHNAFDMAEQAKATLDAIEGLSDIDRDAKLEQMLANAEIVTGEAKVGSNVEIKESLSERLAEKLKGVEWLNEGRIAAVTAFLTNETTMGIMLSVGAIGLKNAISRAGAMIVPGLGAGIVAAVRERRALLDERALMERRSDAGIGFDSEVKAQVELDATLYESRPVGELLNELGGLYDEHGELSMRDRDGLNRAMELQAEIKARMQISDRDGKRLINFSDIDPDQMEDRRFDLDLAMAKLESDMKKAFENPVAQAMLDIKPEENFDALMADQKDIMVGMLSGEMKEKDRVFNKLLASRMMKRFVWTALPVGLMVEGFNHASTFIANVVTDWLGRSVTMDDIALASQGMPLTPEHIGSAGPSHIGGEEVGPDHIGKTTVEGPSHIGANAGPDHIGSAGPSHIGAESKGPDHIGSTGGPDHIGANNAENGPSHIGEKPGIKISDESKIKTPEGFNTEVVGDKVKLTAPDGRVFNLEVGPDGSLTKESLEALNKGGLNVLDRQDPIEGKPTITQKEVSAPEFVQNHKNEMVQIKTTKWFHNNTTQFDLNELKTQNRVDAQGNVIISIKGMTESGSFNGNSGINWKEAANQGLLKTYLSASQGTQAHAFEFTFGPNGELMVPNDSPARAMFDTNGKFTAGYEQISLKGDTLPDGSVGIATLSTVEGEDRPTLVDTIKTPTVATGHSYTLTQIQPQAYTMPPTAPIIPTVPIGGRRKLEEGEEPETPTPLVPLTPIAAAPSGGGPELPPAPERRAITSAESSTRGAETYTAEEQRFVDEVEAERRSFPIGFSAETFGDYSGPSQKLAVKLLHEAVETHPRLLGETLETYQARIAKELRDGVSFGRTKLAAFPPKLRPMVEGAFKLLLEVNQTPGGSAGARAA